MDGVGRGERAGSHGVFFVGAAEVGRVHVHGCGFGGWVQRAAAAGRGREAGLPMGIRLLASCLAR
jgi:hypothetical protein